MLLRLSLLQLRAMQACARETMNAVLDQTPHTPIEITADGWFARLSGCGWIKI